MGIGIGALQVLLKEAARRPFRGLGLLTLGRQDVFFSHKTLRDMAREYRVELLEPRVERRPLKPDFAAQGTMSDENLFEALGFRDWKSLDFSPYEGAQVLFDLNQADLPPALCSAFDVLIDGGTIEHVFHLPNALNNIFRLLRVGGRIVHLVPSHNHLDHGFYMFSPTLFWDYYHANDFEVNTLQLVRHEPPHLVLNPGQVWDYTPGCLEKSSQGGLDSAMYQTICVATKTESSTGDRIPQQGSYAQKDWKDLPTLEGYLVKVNRAMAEGDTREAGSVSLEMVKHFPDDPAAWLARAKALRSLNQYPEAVLAVERSLRIRETPDGLSELARLCLAFGLNREADSLGGRK